MKNKINVVVDLETLSLRSDAAILSIAAVPFNPCGMTVPDCLDVYTPLVRMDGLLTQVTEEPFYEVVNATSCAFCGMHFEQETVDFWAQQDEEVKAELLSHDPIHIGEAMNMFHNYLVLLEEKYDAEVVVWCHGTDFDIPILKNAYRNLMQGVKEPWSHKNLRDARTYLIQSLETLYGYEEDPYKRIPPLPDGGEWMKHSALSDARNTAWSIAYVNSRLLKLCRGEDGQILADEEEGT